MLRQIAYAKSVRRVIRAIMRRMLDGEWINHIFASSDKEFNNRLDEAFKSLDILNATKGDFCRVVVNVLCDEVSKLCQVLKEVCEGSGYGKYFESHISHDRFVRLVLSADSGKIEKMMKIVDDKRLTPIDILRGVGAVLNDEPLEERAALCERDRRNANAEVKAFVADVESKIQTGFAEIKSGVAEVGAKVDAVDAKVSKLKRRRQRRSKYDEAVVSFCVACVEAAQKDSMLVKSGNGKPKMEDVFSRYRAKLRDKGVVEVATFKRILHACRARESRTRIKELHSKQDAAKRKQASAEYGIMRGGERFRR